MVNILVLFLSVFVVLLGLMFFDLVRKVKNLENTFREHWHYSGLDYLDYNSRYSEKQINTSKATWNNKENEL